MSIESKGLIQQYYDSLPYSQENKEKLKQWTPFVLHSHAMVADMRAFLVQQGFTEEQAIQEVLWPEAKQPITSRIKMLQEIYGDIFGSTLPIHFSDHAAHPLLADVYDSGNQVEKKIQIEAFRTGNIQDTIKKLSAKALIRHQLMQQLAKIPHYSQVRLLNSTEVDILESGIRLEENGIDTPIIPGLVDISHEALTEMDIVQVSYHPDEVEARSGITVEQMTYDRYLPMIIEVIKNNPVDVFSHPLRELTPQTLDVFETILNQVLDPVFDNSTVQDKDVQLLMSFFRQVQESQVALEFNLSDARDTKPKRIREIAVTTKLLRAAKKMGCQYFTFGSDFHDLGKWKLLDDELKENEQSLYESTADSVHSHGDHFDSFAEAQEYTDRYNAIVADALDVGSMMKKILSPYEIHIARLSRHFEPSDFINTVAGNSLGRFDEFLERKREMKQRYLRKVD